MEETKENITSLQIVCEYILLHIAHFAALTEEERIKFFKTMKEFIRTYYSNSTVSKNILTHPEVKKNLPTLRGLFLLFEKKLEKQLAEQYVIGNIAPLKNYLEEYQNFLKQEGEMAGLNINSNVIVLGSGYLPGTAMLLHKLFKAKITCLDHDLEAIDFSKRFIEKLNLGKGIAVEFGDAMAYPLSNFDTVFVTGSCFPKSNIFDHILNETNDGKIVYRNPVGLYKLWYTPATKNEVEKFNIIKNINSSGEFPFDTLLLKK